MLMKANSKSAQKESWVDALYETIEDNVLATVLVLHEQFGFGEKRIEQLKLKSRHSRGAM